MKLHVKFYRLSMNKYETIKKIEKFAPPELAENWDCSGWIVETDCQEISRIMLALTVTGNVIKQALNTECGMIISHHPLFHVPVDWKKIDIYCAHTNLDKTTGGTTDTLIADLGLNVSETKDFLRFVNCEYKVNEFIKKLKKISPNLRYINNRNTKIIKKIAFCAGSGFEFLEEAKYLGADAFVSGDLKFHRALESDIVLFDAGHFETETGVLKVLASLIDETEIVYAKEHSPFIYP